MSSEPKPAAFYCENENFFMQNLFNEEGHPNIDFKILERCVKSGHFITEWTGDKKMSVHRLPSGERQYRKE